MSMTVPTGHTVTEPTADVGVIGMAVMGSNLARNFASHGYTVALYNRTPGRTRDLMAAYGKTGSFGPTESVDAFVASLVVDGGNSHFPDTIRRERALRERGLHFVGAGISGGEEGALLGPAIMPGGTEESYKSLGPMLENIAAKVDGVPCCTHVGPDGAGHFVKMVHNGIE